MKKRHEEWMHYAEDDLAFARAGLKDGFHSHVCILSQQAVEKALKGYLVFKGKNPPKTHGLVTLHRLMEIEWLDPHLTALKALSGFYVPLRYPDTAGTLPEGPPNAAVASKALHWAEEIIKTVRGHLKG